MPYIIIEDFRGGLDKRKLAAASPQGTLQTLTNAHVTRGGEIEKRKAMVATYSLPEDQTFGLDGANGVLYTFGSDASPAVPTGVTYQQLVHASAESMTDIRSTEFFDGKVFAVAEYANGDVLHFYNGAEVADFTTGSGAGVAGQVFTSLLTYGSKLYGTAGSVLHFSGIDAPAGWKEADVGSGFKNMANQSAGSETLTALGKYQGLAAVFARRNIQLWFLDPDDTQNAQRQVLGNIGTYAPKSVVSFGEIDVFFLADSGVRSLRARSSSDRAGVSDVGTPIDEELKEYLLTLTEAEKAAAVATIDPDDGRYLLSVGERTYTFTYFGEERISAWSRYDYGFSVSHYASIDGRLYARAGDTVYLYGGASGDEYDSSEVVVELPFIDGRSIATFKQFKAVDVVCEGEWLVEINTDPTNEEEWSEIARINGTTIALPAIGMNARSPVIKFRFTNEKAGPARLSKLIVHYETAEAS